ncbi:uncharacterized protein LOC128919024 [Rissa tridactyla]|uniref:uncharacterized protein LOC128919024 n=1 Tax=Rissa tridactyla TaxID=75485 RepID=UPI0023BA3EA6|nr:uncharacterized protein LOC128919024 [Rissa tridactyla]
MFLGEAEGLILHYTKGFGHRAFCHPRVPPVFGCCPHLLTLNIFTSDLDLAAAAQQTPLGLVPGEISVQQKLSGGGGSLLHPTLMAAVGRCSRAAESPQGGGTLLDDARPALRTELGLLEEGGSCLPPPITAYLSEPESPRQRGREQVPPRPSAWSSRLRRCFLQSRPLLFFPIAFGNPTKSIPRVRTFVIFTIFLFFFFSSLRKELHLLLGASLRRQPKPSYAWNCSKQRDSLPIASALGPAALVPCARPCPHLLFPCCLPAARGAALPPELWHLRRGTPGLSRGSAPFGRCLGGDGDGPGTPWPPATRGQGAAVATAAWGQVLCCHGAWGRAEMGACFAGATLGCWRGPSVATAPSKCHPIRPQFPSPNQGLVELVFRVGACCGEKLDQPSGACRDAAGTGRRVMLWVRGVGKVLVWRLPSASSFP